jgi:predicted metal-dependent enzyme (double-stranded beta helix superfamily)
MRAEQGDCSLLVAVFRSGAAVPVHDHGSWAAIGIYRGREREARYRIGDAEAPLDVVATLVNAEGDVTVVPDGVAHTVEAIGGNDAVSLHVYGTDIITQERSTYDVTTGAARPYRPGFTDPTADDPR